ncbi:MAG: RNHCP domain-containing protein [Thermomicrobiales bacterium]
MPKISLDDALDLDDPHLPIRSGGRRKQRPPERYTPAAHRVRSEEFKCGHCRTFVGPPLSGGRHRNHCPLCLYSRHVDRQSPGDRLSDCRSLMAPVATWFRRNGEQVIVHRCLGCDIVRNCRVAADDYHAVCMKLDLWILDDADQEDAQLDHELPA